MTTKSKSPLTHFVKVERRLEGGKKGFVLYWSDGRKWYRHGEAGHTPRVLRSTNRTIGILERKVSKFFPRAKIEMRASKDGDLSDDMPRLDVEVKPLPFVAVKQETVGKLRKDKVQLEAKVKVQERQIRELQTQVGNFQRVFAAEPVPIPQRGQMYNAGAIQEYSNDRLGVAVTDDCEIVLPRSQWEKLIRNRTHVFEALHAFSADLFPVTTMPPRRPGEDEPR